VSDQRTVSRRASAGAVATAGRPEQVTLAHIVRTTGIINLVLVWMLVGRPTALSGTDTA
jgi:hypothetical protein